MTKWHILGWQILLPFKPRNCKKLEDTIAALGFQVEFHLVPIRKTERTAYDYKGKKVSIIQKSR